MMIHVMQYLGKRATFSMIARNDEMNKLNNFRNRESLFCVNLFKIQQPSRINNKHYFSFRHRYIRQRVLPCDGTTSGHTRKNNSKFITLTVPSSSSYVTTMGSVRCDRLLLVSEITENKAIQQQRERKYSRRGFSLGTVSSRILRVRDSTFSSSRKVASVRRERRSSTLNENLLQLSFVFRGSSVSSRS